MICICLVAFKANAQVTIGGALPPQKGATLDLNAAFKGGLLLPNVVITDLGKIPATFSDASVQGADVAATLSGLVAYNTTENVPANISKGFYMWDGNDWKLLAVDTGHITIPASTPGYDPSNSLGATVNNNVEDVPVINPSLTIEGAYVFSIIAGNDYAEVYPQSNYTPEFSVNFMPNATALPRKAIVLITDPSGKTGTFVFTQEGSACENDVNVSVSTLKNATSFCANGSVHAFVSAVSTGAISDYTYYWTLNGVAVETDAGVELSQAGTYKVYADKIGCGTPATLTITGPSTNTASNAPRILVDNEGILCGTNGVRLSALNAPSSGTLYWLQDGVQKASGGTYYNIPGDAANEGLWYAVYDDGTCLSTSSNKVPVSYQSSVSSLNSINATINGASIGGLGTTVCAGGTLKLEVVNATDYAGATFEWFANGESLGKTTAATMYVVPPAATKLVLSLTITASGTCPVSVTSPEFTVTQSSTPPATSINDGDEYAYICGMNPAELQASNASGVEYEWFWNGIHQNTPITALNSVLTTGKYSVRYKTATGCWSTLSQEINVVQSSQLTAVWAVAPAAQEIIGSNKTYSIAVAPEAQRFEWEPVNPAYTGVATITPLGNGSAATVKFNGPVTTDYEIKVKAFNVCGNTELVSGAIDVVVACIPAGSLLITPSTAQTIKQNQTVNFTANANVGSDDAANPMTYTWYVDGSSVKSSNSAADKKTLSYSFTSVKPYTVQVKAQNDNCGSVTESTVVNITVTLDPSTVPANPNPDANAATFSGGKTCLDIHKTEDTATNSWSSSARLPKSTRPNDFADGNTREFKYTFGGKNISNIRFYYDDPGSIIESVTGEANSATATATVKFKSTIVASGTGTLKNDALKVTLYAVYNNGSTDYKESIEIKVQDAACGCPAKVSSTTWKMFACHNAGANTDSDPLGNGANVRGAYYLWGNGRPFLFADRSTNSSHNFAKVNEWTAYQDPCPTGWRVATADDWRSLRSNNSLSTSNGQGYAGTYLAFPLQGYAYRSSNLWSSTGTSHLTAYAAGRYDYWTRSNSSGDYGTNIYGAGWGVQLVGPIIKYYAEPVKCVQEGTAYSQND